MVVAGSVEKDHPLLKTLIWVAVCVLAVAACLGLVFYVDLASNLPSIEVLNNFRPSLASLVFDDKDEKVHEFYIERRVWTPITEIPKLMQDAIIAVEDSRFYQHHGIDWLGIIRAAWANLRHRRIEQGASTITQQLARRLFLTPEKTLTRKLKEVILARKIERMLNDKKKILEYYLNEIYFGAGAYGVAAAAQVYFGKRIEDLSLAQYAMLAGLPRAPNRYSPFKNKRLALARRNVALKRMAEEGYITDAECRMAQRSPLGTVKPEDTTRVPVGAWFFEHIRRTAMKIFQARSGETEEGERPLYSASAMDWVYRNGLNIYSTIDMELQRAAEEAVERGLRRLDKRQGFRGPVADAQPDRTLSREMVAGGLITYARVTKVEKDRITVDFGKGLVGIITRPRYRWALAGKEGLGLKPGDVIEVKVDRKYKPGKAGPVPLWLEQEPEVEGALVAIELHTGYVKAMVGGRDYRHSKFNRAIQSRRQPGSAFKPVIYTAAIDSGMIPTDIILDVPVYVDEIDKVWKPENYAQRFFGPITLQTALERSRNLATVNLIRRIGPKLAVKYAKLLGISSKLEAVPSLALGSMGVSLLELTTLYGVFGSGGKRFEPIFIRRIVDHSGKEIYREEPRFEQVLSPQTAYVMTYMLEGVVQRGTGVRAKVLHRPLAGKTGTTNECIDAWFIGFSPDLVVGVWVGFDELKSLGKRETGARAALPIWIEFMKAALEGAPEKDFAVPDGIVFKLVDARTGQLASEDCPDAILEAFIAGTEPTKAPAHRQKAPEHFAEIDTGL